MTGFSSYSAGSACGRKPWNSSATVCRFIAPSAISNNNVTSASFGSKLHNMKFGLYGVLLCLVTATYLYPNPTSVARLTTIQPFSSHIYDNELYILGKTQDTLSVSKLQTQNFLSLWSISVSFTNVFSLIDFAVSSDAIYIALNMNWTYTETLPGLTSSQNPRSGTTHGLVIGLNKDSGAVKWTTWAGSCLSSDSFITDIVALQSEYVVGGFDRCSSGVWLSTSQWTRYIPGNGNCTYASMAGTGTGLYLTTGCTDTAANLIPVVMRLTTMGDVLWSKLLQNHGKWIDIQIAAAMVMPLAGLDYISIATMGTNNITASLLDSNGVIQWTTTVPATSLTGLALDPAKGLLVTTTESIIWLSYDSIPRAKRPFTGGSLRGSASLISGLESIVLLFSSSATMFDSSYSGSGVTTVVAKLQSPFSLGFCSALCSSCFGPSASECFTCAAYQSAAFTCGACDSGCLSCFGPSRSQCRSCAGNYRLQGTECLLDLNCPDGQYTNQKTSACESCDSSCSSCSDSGPTFCLTCASGLLRNDKLCVSACPAYRYPKLGLCEDCAQPCVSCNGPTSLNCTACMSDKLLAFGECVSKCPDGSYQQGAKCIHCESGCSSCTGPNTCNSCMATYSMLNSHCYNPCPATYFSVSGICSPCLRNCDHCESSLSCTQCQQGFYWNQTACLPVPQCALGAYFNGTKCANCHEKCERCWDGNVTACYSCSAGYFLNVSSCAEPLKICSQGWFLNANNTCNTCPNGCSQCTNATTCTSCKSGFYMSSSTCVTSCPEATFLQNNTCYACDSHCSKCNSASMCLKCDSEWHLYNSTCVEVCPLDTVTQDGKCSLCELGCLECEGRSCAVCNPGLYLQSGHCLACPPQCETCLQTDLCLSCTSDFSLYNSTCQLGCPLGFTAVSGVCQPCITGCQQCSTATTCDICKVSLSQYGRYHLSSGVCDLSTIDCYPGYSLKNGYCEAESVSDTDYFWAAVKLTI